MQSSDDTRKFVNQEEMTLFENHLSNYLNLHGIDRKTVLWGIHESYLIAKKYSHNYKLVVVHEHVSFPFENIINDFNTPNILMILRDPRASLAGFYKGINKKFPNKPDSYNYFYNMSTEEWMCATHSYYKYKDKLGEKLYVIKNENMVVNLGKEMISLSKWMKISYSDSLLKSSSPNTDKWTPDSCYLNRGEDVRDLKDYFSPNNVESRWRSELCGMKEILLIEQIFWVIMLDFGYKPITKRNLINIIHAYLFFIFPSRGSDRFKLFNPTDDELNRKGKILEIEKSFLLPLWNILPKYGKILYIYLSSIFSHIAILFSKNSWSRYDKPLIDDIYRNG